MTAKQPSSQRGISLIELIIFIVVIGAALAGVLKVFVQATSASADPQSQRQALAIAESLMSEVQLMPFTFCDPDDANVEVVGAACASQPEAIGPEPGETRYATPQFDNVNDYQGFTMNGGIRDISNVLVPGLGSYSASISVAAADLGSITVGTGDALLITVNVSGPNGTQIVLTGYRSRHSPNAAL